MPQRTIIISPEANKFLKEYSKKTGRTMSGFVDWLLKKFKKEIKEKDVFER